MKRMHCIFALSFQREGHEERLAVTKAKALTTTLYLGIKTQTLNKPH
jgi:hypothetical protein